MRCSSPPDRPWRSCTKKQSWNNLAIAFVFSACISAWVENSPAAENVAPVAPVSDATVVETTKLTIHPRADTRPSLKIQLVPDPTEQLEGNAAVFYLKAMGFLEQDSVRAELRKMLEKGAEQAKAAGKEGSLDYPPYTYLELHPRDYPRAEVQKYLGLLSFQVPSLREARRLRDFTMHRNIHLVDNPLGYLIPEVQSIRDLARTQRIRCRLAIAENRIDDAIEIIGQQLTMSRHIGMDDFLVSYLVGVAVLGIAIEDTFYALEHPECPNLYWAFSQLPSPLISTERCLAFERQVLFLQFPKFKEIDKTPRSPAYWTEMVADFSKRSAEIDEYGSEPDLVIASEVTGEKREEAIRKSIAANVPQAKEYLLGRGILTKDDLESYPPEQLVFLAMRDYCEVVRDEHFKWFHCPYGVAQKKLAIANQQMKKDREKFGWFTRLPNALLPAIERFSMAVTRTEQRIAIVQAIEAIRMAGAENGGKLIRSLDEAPVPIPNDPFTGNPFSYQVTGDVAVLASDPASSSATNAADGSVLNDRPFRFELKFAP